MRHHITNTAAITLFVGSITSKIGCKYHTSHLLCASVLSPKVKLNPPRAFHQGSEESSWKESKRKKEIRRVFETQAYSDYRFLVVLSFSPCGPDNCYLAQQKLEKNGVKKMWEKEIVEKKKGKKRKTGKKEILLCFYLLLVSNSQVIIKRSKRERPEKANLRLLRSKVWLLT